MIESISVMFKPKFDPGAISMTRGVKYLVEETGILLIPLLERHVIADWGDVNEEDKEHNNEDLAAMDGGRVISSWEVLDHKIWIITSGLGTDYVCTTFMLPEEY